jgi:Alpha-acetolactate decarboxylase
MEWSTRWWSVVIGLGLVILAVFLYTSLAPERDRDTAYQVSTIDALLQGALEGVQTVAEIKKHGDFGIGTFDGLEGEMIVQDGTVYQARADGQVSVAADTLTVPLATVTYFDRDLVLTPGTSMNYTTFIAVMPGQMPTPNMVYAVRIHGDFPSMKVRAIPAQERPSNLTLAVQEQSVL